MYAACRDVRFCFAPDALVNQLIKRGLLKRIALDFPLLAEAAWIEPSKPESSYVVNWSKPLGDIIALALRRN